VGPSGFGRVKHLKKEGRDRKVEKSANSCQTHQKKSEKGLVHKCVEFKGSSEALKRQSGGKKNPTCGLAEEQERMVPSTK